MLKLGGQVAELKFLLRAATAQALQSCLNTEPNLVLIRPSDASSGFDFFMKHLVFQNNLSPGRRRQALGAMGEPRKQLRNVSSAAQPA